MKKLLGIALVMLLIGSFAWTAGQSGRAAAPEQVVLRLAETHGPDYPTTLGNKEFARLVEERTNGRIRIEVYPSAQLGEERSVIEQVQFGGIDMTRVSISPLAAFAPQLDALQMPFLYRDKDHMWKVLRGDIGAEIMATLEESGFVGLAWYDSGSRSFYTKRPVRQIPDMRGLRIRVQESELMVGLVEALGAVATPMPFGEVYSALQTGVIDGAENNWPSYYSTSHFEVANYFTLNHHTRVPEIIVASKISMDRLSPEDQEIIRQAAWDSMDFQIEKWEAFELEAEEVVRANGNVIIELDDLRPWQEAMQPLYARLSPANQRVVERIQAVR